MAIEKSPVEWALTPLKKYAQFSGRAPRAEYWWFYLLLIVAYIVAVTIDMTLGSSLLGPYGILTVVVWLGAIIPTLAVGVRRLHDTNRTGWWMLAPIVPYLIGAVLMGPALLNPEAAAAPTASMGVAGIFMLIGGVMAIVLFVFTVLPGTKGPNNYGPDPYGADVEQVFA
jgi:uncharacterized membrane protein YhaH (DUF805 family)